uniref:Uncharacterized protein n=1 Tax=Arundo donax TaxID=35708 RepID=A0A0A8YE58_ARUDO
MCRQRQLVGTNSISNDERHEERTRSAFGTTRHVCAPLLLLLAEEVKAGPRSTDVGKVCTYSITCTVSDAFLTKQTMDQATVQYQSIKC